MHVILPSELLHAICTRAETLRFELAEVPLSRRRPGMVHARYFTGKVDRYEDSGWICVGKIRDALVRKHLLIWWNERTDEVRCEEPPRWP